MSGAAIRVAICLLGLAVCCGIDLRTRTIPNWLTGTLFLCGIISFGAEHGLAGFAWSSVGAVACAALLVPSFTLGGIGGGDVKMMGAVGALLGPRLGLYSLAAGLVAGGVVMVVHLAILGRLGEKLASMSRMMSAAVRSRSTAPLRISDSAPDAVTLPYSFPLAFGTVVVLVFQP